MENRRTESIVPESEPEEDTEVESEVMKNVDDPDVSVVDSEVETPKSQKRKLLKKPKMSFEDNLLKLLETRKVEDPVSSFLMSSYKKLQKVLAKIHTLLRQSIMLIHGPYNLLSQLSMTVLMTHIRLQQTIVNITLPSSPSTSLGLGAYQSPSAAAMPQLYYNPNSTQTVTAPVSTSTTLFTYSSLNTDEYHNSK
ncbi:unnamed protein product [Macrosiphum euphorbiae]|uniref:BESS domain-containing protein n=1 Tax=Macrosiphum euphorbiae TaxID=13131 RepID=A0AAV0W2X0_9HEMI|nr:unnamed protein product [Macrosiphum euphorbiae]